MTRCPSPRRTAFATSPRVRRRPASLPPRHHAPDIDPPRRGVSPHVTTLAAILAFWPTRSHAATGDPVALFMRGKAPAETTAPAAGPAEPGAAPAKTPPSTAPATGALTPAPATTAAESSAPPGGTASKSPAAKTSSPAKVDTPPPAASTPPPAKTTATAKAGHEATASDGSSPTTENGPEADADANADTNLETGRRYSARARGSDDGKWIHRYPPANHTAEFGVYGGVWFPSKRLELFEPDPSLPDDGHQRLGTVGFEGGLRVGYYPLRFVGVEAEGGVMPSRTRDTDARATAWALRGHLVGQLALWSVTPFLLAGVGILGVSGDDPPDSLGQDQDVAIHFGGGVKVFVTRNIQVRLDVRDVVSNRQGVGEGLTSSPEILLGVTFALGPKRSRRPAPTNHDRDGDHIRNEDDYCPDVFGEAPRGCPQVCVDDNDADGLSNLEDACPMDPETRNGFEDGDGCPDEVPEELGELVGVMEGIQFDTDKDTIKDASRPTIDHAIEIMERYPSLRVEIVGHTDDRGDYRHNIELSERRATSVREYMTGSGIDPTRLETRGAGPDEPIATNENADGRAKNRRIEFRMLDEATP